MRCWSAAATLRARTEVIVRRSPRSETYLVGTLQDSPFFKSPFQKAERMKD
jgi:hypothetical protein